MTGEQLIKRWAVWLQQWIYMTEAQSVVLALWAMHTWCYEQFAATPYLSVTASTKRSGKTSVLEALKMLSRGADVKATIRAVSAAREIEALEGQCTLMWDEAEKLSSQSLGETRTILATGYRRGANHTVTMNGKVERFRTYCPKAFASIGDIQDVLRDRSIVIDLVRMSPARSLTLYRETAEQQASELVAEFIDVMKALALKRLPVIDPEWLTSPRDREIWTPLFSLSGALDAGKHTSDLLVGFSVDNSNFKQLPARVFHSAQAEDDTEQRTMAERLLRDLVGVYAAAEGWLPSQVLVDRLRGIVTAPWRSWRGPGLNEIGLSALLDSFGIEKHRQRTNGKGGRGKQENPRHGYRQVDVRDALKKIGA